MNLVLKIVNNIKENAVEYYTLFTIIIAVPFVFGVITSAKWGWMMSFCLQSIIGILYIRGINK